MKYETPIIAVIAFTTGCIVKSIISPSSPTELLYVLEKKLSKDPVKYEQVIDQTMEVSHRMKAQANPYLTEQGYVPFQDLQLAIQYNDGNNLTMLVNTNTEEMLPIRYLNGRTAVGSLQDRVGSVLSESHQKSAEFIERYMPKDKASQKLRRTKEYIIIKSRGLWDRVKNLVKKESKESVS